jgi:hypothetical protein
MHGTNDGHRTRLRLLSCSRAGLPGRAAAAHASVYLAGSPCRTRSRRAEKTLASPCQWQLSACCCSSLHPPRGPSSVIAIFPPSPPREKREGPSHHFLQRMYGEAETRRQMAVGSRERRRSRSLADVWQTTTAQIHRSHTRSGGIRWWTLALPQLRPPYRKYWMRGNNRPCSLARCARPLNPSRAPVIHLLRSICHVCLLEEATRLGTPPSKR